MKQGVGNEPVWDGFPNIGNHHLDGLYGVPVLLPCCQPASLVRAFPFYEKKTREEQSEAEECSRWESWLRKTLEG